MSDDKLTKPTEPTRDPQHVCGLQGFGALGDVCPACELRRQRWDAENPRADEPDDDWMGPG